MLGGKGVGEADQEAGAASGVQGVQGEGSETSEEMQVPGDWREEEQGCPAVLSREPRLGRYALGFLVCWTKRLVWFRSSDSLRTLFSMELDSLDRNERQIPVFLAFFYPIIPTL